MIDRLCEWYINMARYPIYIFYKHDALQVITIPIFKKKW
jgi:hypothetical protein